MRTTTFALWLSVSGLAMAGCSGSEEARNDSGTTGPLAEDAQDVGNAPAAKNTDPVEITWEELMPQGEEERLAQLYEDFYNELDQRMADAAEAAQQSGDTEALVAAITEGSAGDTMEQIGTYNVVSELNGTAIRLPGYVVPFDFSADAEYREFLLVPYFGACLHTPPPPPNQIVFVKADPAATISNIYDPVWVEGVLKTGEFNSDLGNSAYELTLSKVEAYVY